MKVASPICIACIHGLPLELFPFMGFSGYLGGCVMFSYPGGSESLRSQSIPWHVLFGLIVYVLALGTASLGFLEKLTILESSAGVAKYGSEALLVNFTAIVTRKYCSLAPLVLDGKTMLAKAVATGARANFINISMSSITSIACFRCCKFYFAK